MGQTPVDPEDERVLLLLGMLMSQSQHGYQINEFIERNLRSRLSNMRKPTAYALLGRLAAAGLVDATEEREGNRPVRRRYSITETGREMFATMLSGILASPLMMELPGDIALMFVDYLDRADAEVAISARLARLDAEIVALSAAPPHAAGAGVDLAINRRLVLARADRAWFASVLERLPRLLPEQASLTDGTHPHH